MDANISLAELEATYRAQLSKLDRFRDVLVRELNALIDQSRVELSVPIQHRTKTWSSIAEKIDRKALSLEAMSDLPDLVGIRIILQFRRDIDAVCALLQQHFTVSEREDTGQRLKEDQFGYSSIHFIIRAPSAWNSVPSTSGLEELTAEVQIRTTSQHIWASASHVLQYKHEQSVPAELRRGVYRVSALLETVDLEFERLLSDREKYVHQLQQAPVAASTSVNVDVVRQILDEMLPAENKIGHEEYADLITDLLAMGVSRVDELRSVINKHLAAVKEWDRKVAGAIASQDGPFVAPRPGLRVVPTEFGEIHVTDPSRPERGVFFDHIGLVRHMLGYEFGGRWETYNNARSEERRQKRLRG